MFLRSTSFGRLNKREDLCYASKLIRIFGPQSLYPLNPSPIRYHQPLNISCEVQQLLRKQREVCCARSSNPAPTPAGYPHSGLPTPGPYLCILPHKAPA
jgi:hypothetical protein